MRVLVFCSADLGLGSGSEVRARLIVEGLNHWGAEVLVVARGVPTSFKAQGVPSRLLVARERWKEALSKAASRFRPDVIYGITEAGTTAVREAARQVDCAHGFDIHGLGFIEIVELGAGHGFRPVRIAQSLRWLAELGRADVVTVANPTLVPIIQRLSGNVVPVVGMTDTAHFGPSGEVIPLGRDRTKLQVLYAGNFFRWQGVRQLIEGIRLSVERGLPFEFTILGSVGRPRTWPAAMKRSVAAGFLHVLDSVPYAKVPAYYRGADVLVLPRPWTMSAYLAFPQKLVDYLASGRAVLATNLAPHRWALQSTEAGALCESTPRGLLDGLCRLIPGPTRELLAQNGRRLSEERFCHLLQARRILDALAGAASHRNQLKG